MAKYSNFVRLMFYALLVIPSSFFVIVVLWALRGDTELTPVAIGILFVGLLMTFLYREQLEDVFQLDISVYHDGSALSNVIQERLQKRASLHLRIEHQERILQSLGREIAFERELIGLHERNLKHYQSLHENSVRKVQVILDLSKQLFLLIDYDGVVRHVNMAFLMRLHYSEEQVIGKNVRDFVTSSEEDFKTMYRRLRNGSDKPMILPVRTGREGVTEMISFLPLRMENNQYLLSCRAINDDLLAKSMILTKNREVEYINRINASLISNNSTTSLLENIATKITNLFRIRQAAIVQRHHSEYSILAQAGSPALAADDLVPLMRLPNFVQQQDGEDWSMVITLFESADIDLKLALLFNSKISTNDLTIIKMFTNQASIVVQRDRIFENMKKQFVGTIGGLVGILEAKDKYTEGHSRRVQHLALALAKELSLSDEEIELVEIAAILHDLGKIGISLDTLNKSGKLTEEEYSELKTHSIRGYDILKNIDFDSRILNAVAYHHVHYDLSGYPENHGLSELPLFAGLIAVADAFDAMTSSRSYTRPKSVDEALAELRRCKGTQFTPRVVEAMHALCEREPERIRGMLNN